jgi:hypothetical protein
MRKRRVGYRLDFFEVEDAQVRLPPVELKTADHGRNSGTSGLELHDKDDVADESTPGQHLDGEKICGGQASQ